MNKEELLNRAKVLSNRAIHYGSCAFYFSTKIEIVITFLLTCDNSDVLSIAKIMIESVEIGINELEKNLIYRSIYNTQ